MKIFFDEKLSNLPFYYRFFQKKELLYINDTIEIKPFNNSIYNIKMYSGNLPMKPISKMLEYENQKDI